MSSSFTCCLDAAEIEKRRVPSRMVTRARRADNVSVPRQAAPWPQRSSIFTGWDARTELDRVRIESVAVATPSPTTYVGRNRVSTVVPSPSSL